MDLSDLLSSKAGDEEKNKSSESPLKSLKVDLELYKEAIKEVADEIVIEGVSAYPIFIAHQHEMAMGEVILDRNELGTQWSIHASTMEDFVEKGIVEDAKKEFFMRNYKDPADFMCLFVIVPEGANFVFYPYKK